MLSYYIQLLFYDQHPKTIMNYCYFILLPKLKFGQKYY